MSVEALAVALVALLAGCAGGTVLGYYWHQQDCERRVRGAVEAARKESERAISRAREHNLGFVSALAHDVRGPLRALSSFADLIVHLLDAADGPEGLDQHRVRDFAGRIVDGARHLDDLVTELRNFAVESAGGASVKCKPAEEVITGAVARITPALEEAGGELDVYLQLPDTARLKTSVGRVVQNLLDNAIKYAGEAPPRVRLNASSADGKVVIAVADEGMGFAPDDAEIIFEMLRQLHPHQDSSDGGFGMGLALCREIVERLGGSIAAYSDGPGTGARFVVELPVSSCACPPNHTPAQ